MRNNKDKIIENGAEIKCVFLIGGQISGNDRERIELLHTYHGEYDLDWAVIIDRETGKELKRFNLKMCEGVAWEAEI